MKHTRQFVRKTYDNLKLTMWDVLLRRAVNMDSNHMMSVNQSHREETYEYRTLVEEQPFCLNSVASSMVDGWASLRGPTKDDGTL